MNSSGDDWFVIKDLNSFVEHSRKLVFSSYGNEKKSNDEDIDIFEKLSDQDQDELDTVLSFDETMNIVKSFVRIEKNRKTKKIRHLVSDMIYIDIIQSLGDRMTSNILNGLVNKGVVESAYDSELDDFVFWVKEEKK